MSPSNETPPTGEMLNEVLDLVTGLGILTLPLMFMAIPALILLLPLALPAIPLAILAAPYLLIRAIRRRLSARPSAPTRAWVPTTRGSTP